ncbi:cysteine--tRNA ligase [[Mycoplasma] anseris]|uniref:Cysteine--tRNA ligase n=3 Tax=[Mycoplasma] anseris TaxID=92400 RepID=A0A2Z4ND00_9BACT|nr:cysteine--tRNA ligase [[Mycoplasma] anseris]AWX69345.1 cysteine--tRNA ligase [[Mycoplasma] anseris]
MKKYYLCGPTVYNYPHIGNIRPTVTFDLMIRAQKFLGEEIFYLHNITDIDDKIIKRAIEENKTEKEISSLYEEYYWSLFKQFNLELPTKAVRVTDSLNDLYSYIQKLIENKAAYQVGTNVFFDTSKFKEIYGTISGQKIENLVSDDNELGKNNPRDFALWKETQVGVKYDSPFGLGRPGWHTECSCFIAKYFNGESLDFHGGGIDLVFPHHENENIQHYAIFKKPISKGWIHFGTLNYKNQKMSKSLGNIIFPHTFLEKYEADSYKWLILTTNYAKPINLTDELFELNQSQIDKFKLLWNKFQLENEYKLVKQDLLKSILKLIANLDFANAIREIIKLSKNIELQATFFEILKVLGFIFVNHKINQEDLLKYQEWKTLVNNKEFEKADIIRNELKNKGII